MKWFRIALAIFLLVGMLLCAGVAYADDGEGEGGGDNPGDEGNPGDGGVEGSGLNVTVTVVGNNSDVGVDLYGDDNTANVNFHSENPSVYINGQDINQPTVIYQGGGGGVEGSWVKKKINQAVGPIYSWAEEAQARIGLTADGLAKLIMIVKDQDSQLGETSADVDDLYPKLDDFYNRLEGIDGELSSLEGEHDALVSEVRLNYQELVFEIEMMEWQYNRILVIMSGAFLLVVMGLGIGFGVSIHRLRKRIIG